MSTKTRSKTDLGLRIAVFLLGIVVLIWLSIEDESIIRVVIVSGAICIWAGFWVLLKPVEGGKQIILRHSLVGIGAGLAIVPLTILLMALKSGIHGHGTPDFTVYQIQSVISRTPFFVLSGFLIGLGSGVWRLTRRLAGSEEGITQMPFAGDIHFRRLRLETQGKTLLLLIHGAGGSYLYWPGELRRLAGKDVLAIDLPGHGDSRGESRDSIGANADEVLKFLDRLKIDQVVLCGHSMGGAIAMQLCLDHPERAIGLILIGSGAKYEVNPKLIEYCESGSSYPHALDLIMKFSFSQATDKRLVELAMERMAETSPKILQADFIACDRFEIGNQLTEINQPTLVICGEEDRMMPVSCSQLLFENIPNARLEIIPEAGHMVILEQPGAVAQLIHEFLDEIKLQNNTPG